MNTYNVYTYYEELGNGYELSVLDLWKRSWKSLRWIPIVLSEEDAKQAKEYQVLIDKVSKWPTVNDPRYELACFKRWAAVSTLKPPVFFLDYDIMNQSLDPDDVCDDQSYFLGNPFRVGTPPMILLDPSIALKAILAYEKSFFLIDHSRPHMSDMYIIRHLLNHFVSLTGFWPDRTHPLVHFPNVRIFNDQRPKVISEFLNTISPKTGE